MANRGWQKPGLSKGLIVGCIFIFLGISSIALGLLKHTDELKASIPEQIKETIIKFDPQTAGRIAAVKHIDETNVVLIAEAIAYYNNVKRGSNKPIDPEELKQYLFQKLAGKEYTAKKDSFFLKGVINVKENDSDSSNK